jgi:hypothetical protein
MNFEILSAIFSTPDETSIVAQTTIGAVAIQLPPAAENVVGGHDAYARWTALGNTPQPFKE